MEVGAVISLRAVHIQPFLHRVGVQLSRGGVLGPTEYKCQPKSSRESRNSAFFSPTKLAQQRHCGVSKCNLFSNFLKNFTVSFIKLSFPKAEGEGNHLPVLIFASNCFHFR